MSLVARQARKHRKKQPPDDRKRRQQRLRDELVDSPPQVNVVVPVSVESLTIVEQSQITAVQQTAVSAPGQSRDGRTSSTILGIIGNNLQLIMILVLTGIIAATVNYAYSLSNRQDPIPATPIPTATIAPTSTPVPTKVPESTARIIGRPKVECNPADGPPYIEVNFRLDHLVAGESIRVFGRSARNTKYYPSKKPSLYTNGEGTAIIYVGPAESYGAHIFASTGTAEEEVTGYLQSRERDHAWGLGMELPDEIRSKGLDYRDDIPGCRPPTPTLAPKARPVGAR